MEVEVLEKENSACAENQNEIITFDIIREFDDFSNIIELTNVFQLRVEKAKYHLENLKKSGFFTNRNRNSDMTSSKNYETSSHLSIKNYCLQISEIIPINKLINNNDLVPLTDLLSEICLLISQLEIDRQVTENEISKERKKVEELLKKLSNISFFRMDMLPSAVQKEHESCANDISELHWHVKHRTQIEKKLRQKRNKAEETNEEFREKIEALKQQIPLVQEKLELEEIGMVSIDETKELLVKESEISAERHRITKEKHCETNRKIESEREQIKKDLHKANKQLLSVQKALKHGEKEHGKLLDFKGRNEDKIKQNHKEITRLISENQAKHMEQQNLEEMMNKLNRKKRELELENKNLNDKLLENQTQFKNQEELHEEIRLLTNNTKAGLEQNLSNLKRTNNQIELEIEYLKESQKKSLAEKDKNQKSIVSSKAEIHDSKKQYQETIENFNNVSKQHALVQRRLMDETRKINDTEENLRKTLSGLENAIKQEKLSKVNFESKIDNDSQEFETTKQGAFDKQKQLGKSLNDVLLHTKEISAQVTDLELQRKNASDTLVRLRENYQALLINNERLIKEKSETIENSILLRDDLKAQLDVLIQKENHMEWQIHTMNSQLTEMFNSKGFVIKSKKQAQESLLTLEKDHNSIALELEVYRKKVAKTEERLTKINSQSNRFRNVHTGFIQERQNVLKNFETELMECLAENKSLASQYREVQTDFYSMQNSFLDVIQQHLWGEENIKSLKEVQRLQKFMHNNLDVFFSIKLMYNEDQFFDLQRESVRSEENVKQLKDKYSIYVEKIKEFVQNNFYEKNFTIKHCE